MQAKGLIGKEAAVTLMSQERRMFGHFVVWTIFLFVFKFRHHHRVALPLSGPSRTVACLKLACEIVYIHN